MELLPILFLEVLLDTPFLELVLILALLLGEMVLLLHIVDDLMKRGFLQQVEM